MVGIIAANNVRFSPYIFYYTNLLNQIGVDYEIVVPNRNPEIEDCVHPKTVYLKWNTKRHSLLNYISYSREVKKITNRKYDYLIILTTVNAVFCYPWLRKRYKKRYVVDIRDYTYEKNKIFFELEKRAIKDSKCNVISSKKFRVFLPQGKYLVCHNINTPNQESTYSFEKKKGRIIIGYIGALSYESQCEKIMDLVNKDERFEFHFYGTGVAEKTLKEHAKKYNNPRIKFMGKYENSEKENIIQKVDILFNLYGNGRPLVDYALSNKLYDALYYHKPLLTSPNTYMQEIGGDMAFSLDLNTSFDLDELWDWYQELDKKAIDNYAHNLYQIVVQENARTQEKIKSLFK